MPFTPNNSKIIDELVTAGIIPPECRSFQLNCEVSKAVTITTTSFISPESFQKLADVLKANPEEARRIVRDCIFEAPGKADALTFKAIEAPE